MPSGHPWLRSPTLLTASNFQNNEKIWISCVDRALLSDGEKYWLDKCYSDSAPLETTIKRWYADFKRGCRDTNDAECSGQPKSAAVLEKTKKFHKLLLANHKLKLHVIAEMLKI